MSFYDNNEDIEEFLKQASKFSLLSSDETNRLIEAYQVHGDKSAKNKLIAHNLRLIISIAKKYRNRGLHENDLIQEGAIGLSKAIDKFDASKGFKLSTYGTWWIRQGVGRALEDKGKIIRVPTHMTENINKFRRAVREFVQENQELPTMEEISEILKITPEKAEELRKHMQDTLSLNEGIGDIEGITIGDMEKIDSDKQPEEAIECTEDKSYLMGLLEQLPDDERAFMIFKYGIEDGIERDKVKLSQYFNIPVEEVNKKERLILNKLRDLADREKINMESKSDTFDILLTCSGNDRFSVIRYLSERLELRLVITAELVSNIPHRIFEKLSREEADRIMIEMRMLGAGVQLVKHV